MTEPVFTVTSGAATDAGLVRTNNEDSYLAAAPVFLVADGMGGHERGEIASKIVADSFANAAAGTWFDADDLIHGLEQAADQISALNAGGRAPGSTVSGVGLTLQAGMPCWLVFNVGDSRTFILRDGELVQVSVDHSASRSIISPDGVPVSRMVITRALGAGLGRPVADQWVIPAVEGDRILICSDGLSNEVTHELLAATILSNVQPQDAADALVSSAITAGGRDNITVVIVECTQVVSATGVPVDADDTTAANEDDTVPDNLVGA